MTRSSQPQKKPGVLHFVPAVDGDEEVDVVDVAVTVGAGAGLRDAVLSLHPNQPTWRISNDSDNLVVEGRLPGVLQLEVVDEEWLVDGEVYGAVDTIDVAVTLWAGAGISDAVLSLQPNQPR